MDYSQWTNAQLWDAWQIEVQPILDQGRGSTSVPNQALFQEMLNRVDGTNFYYSVDGRLVKGTDPSLIQTNYPGFTEYDWVSGMMRVYDGQGGYVDKPIPNWTPGGYYGTPAPGAVVPYIPPATEPFSQPTYTPTSTSYLPGGVPPGPVAIDWGSPWVWGAVALGLFVLARR
jgi:hypothetical protein